MMKDCKLKIEKLKIGGGGGVGSPALNERPIMEGGCAQAFPIWSREGLFADTFCDRAERTTRCSAWSDWNHPEIGTVRYGSVRLPG